MIWFIIGFFVGATAGSLARGIITMARDDDDL